MTTEEALEILLSQVEHDLAVDHIGKAEHLREAFEIVRENIKEERITRATSDGRQSKSTDFMNPMAQSFLIPTITRYTRLLAVRGLSRQILLMPKL